MRATEPPTCPCDRIALPDAPVTDEAGLAALLAHERGHVDDCVAMTRSALVSIAIWYGSQDPDTSDELAAYEHATDEKALARGCASETA